MGDVHYLTCADTAKLVRTALRESFPGVKFSVRAKTYSGGASISVWWTDGPMRADVEAVARQFEGADFDGMIDLKSSRQHWLTADGRVRLAYREGTTGSRGVIELHGRRADSGGTAGAFWGRFHLLHAHSLR